MRTRTCRELLAEYRRPDRRVEATKLAFVGVDGLDVYNICAPFGNPENPAQVLIAGRVEARDSERSTIRFFTQTPSGQWLLVPGLPAFDLQDPFVTHLGGVLHLGGVEILEDPEGLPGNPFRYRTVIMACPTLRSARRVFTGPWGMKDIRLVDTGDGRLGVFTDRGTGPTAAAASGSRTSTRWPSYPRRWWSPRPGSRTCSWPRNGAG